MVMTDVVMPKMGGRELCRHLRELKPDIRVVLISGYSFPGDPATRETDGARAFVGKPFDLPRLAQTIRMVLDG
jgi:CheY-like chemotaxis protein